jgi:N-acetylated-alpha-linked acidic dipeptidase
MLPRFLPVLGVLLSTGVAQGAPTLGFTSASKDAEAAAEKAFLDTPTPDQARRWLAALTEEPHVAGTPQEKRVADYVAERFREMGLETLVVRYDVFLNHPKSVSLKMTAPVEQPLSLREEPYDVDKDSASRVMFPAFHGYGASGKAEGEVLYVNYGTKEDFDALKGMGLSPEGRIVLVRYGAVFRGLKVKEAQERGAVGVLIYSDPADDGYMKGDVYPDGPMRPPSAIQRGSVQFLSFGPGDPTTPGVASKPGVRRIPRDKLDTIPRIPSLPISYGEAEKILRHMGGARVPDAWQGGLPFAYHAGPGGSSVAMDVEMKEAFLPIYDVFARIPGASEPDRWVILGNHRDAWTHGAVDPNSGTTAMLEAARGLAAALKAGWKPRRTVLLASWDAEEYGLLGSTEWAEDNAEALKNAVAYVNLDVAVTGQDLDAGGAPSLLALLREITGEITEPKKGGSLLEAWEKREQTEWAKQGSVDLGGPERPFELRLNPLGSGSDYTAFLDHLGVPCLDFTFRGPYGVYHSVYDDLRWMEKYGDPGFVYHVAASKILGLLAMRLSSAEVLPLRFGSYASTLREELDDLRRRALRLQRKPLDKPTDKPAINPDFTPVLHALDEFEAAGRQVDEEADRAARTASSIPRVNEALLRAERAFLSPEGLPRRSWFRHVLTAPGTTTGYAAWPFPGLAQAVEDRDSALFAAETQKVLAALGGAARILRGETEVEALPR